MQNVRTWIEINRKALRHNAERFLKLIPEKTKMMAVVKSNAYGHGLQLIAKQLAGLHFPSCDFQKRLWFGVDSVVEALKLRRENIPNRILILGSTLPARLKEAAENDFVITVSCFESLNAVIRSGEKPAFHLKIDTGMHRQGFLPSQIRGLIRLLKKSKLVPRGIYTHFASAKDVNYPDYTLRQWEKFKETLKLFGGAGFKNMIKHAAASGGTILFPETHLDMVRTGMGLYGYWPSPEAKTQFSLLNLNRETKGRRHSDFSLKPVLTWKAVISETKEIPAGSFVGYDLTERVSRKTKIAVLPVGYWHGYDRGLSGTGAVIICGKRAKILGRVSMDMITVDATEIPRAEAGKTAILIGGGGKEEIWADELGLKIGTSQYEFLTRINPLIKRIAL